MANVVILAVLVGALALAWPVWAAVVGVVGAGVVWLRGYLVPYTPAFAPRVVSWLPGSRFDHSSPTDGLDALDGGADGEGILAVLVDAGVVVPDGERLRLADGFADTWTAEMDALARSSDRELRTTAEAIETGVDAARIETAGDETYLVLSDDGSTAWLRRPVAIAEIGAVQASRDVEIPVEARLRAAHALPAFLETCPACGDDLVEGPRSDCCGDTVPAPGVEPPEVLACRSCGVPFHTLEPESGTGS